MGYRLAVDLGTSSTLAAVAVDGGAPQLLELGSGVPAMPSVMYLAEGGAVVVGEEAERRGDLDPARVAREFKRRLGEEAPVTVGGQPFAPQALLVTLLQHVLAVATQRQGGAPSEVVLPYPAGWDDHRRQLLEDAVTGSGVGPVTLLPETQAWATASAARHPLSEGDLVLVHDLGGTLDVGVVARTATGFTVRGAAEHADALGGAAFDEAVYRLVLAGLGDKVRDLDQTDPASAAGLARLRRECVRAKEALSTETATSVRVDLPTLTTTVRLTRPELVPLIRPVLRDGAAVLDRVLTSASTVAADLAAVLLVGGSSRIPLVAPLLERELGSPPATDLHPTHDLVLASLLVGQPIAPEGTAMPVTAPPRPAPTALAAPPPDTPPPLPVTAAAPPVAAPPDAVPPAAAPEVAVPPVAVPPVAVPPVAVPPVAVPPVAVPPVAVPPVAAAAADPVTWVPRSASTPVRPPAPEQSIPTARSASTAPDSWLSSVLAESEASGPSWSSTPPGGQPAAGSGYTGGPPPAYSGGPPPGSPGPATAPGGQPPRTPGGPGRPGGPPPGSGGGSSRRLLLVIGAAVLALALLVGVGVLVVRALNRPAQVAAPPPEPLPVPAGSPASGAATSSAPSGSTSAAASATPLSPGGSPASSSTPGAPAPGTPVALPTSAPLPLTTAVVPMKIQGERDLYLVDTTKRNKPVRLPSPNGKDGSPVLPPQRNTIIYLNEGQPRVMAADGTGDRVLTDTLPKGCDTVQHLAWSPTDTNLLVMQCQSTELKSSIQEIHLDGTLVKRLSIAKDVIQDISISTDGLLLVYWASNNLDLDGGSIYSMRVDGTEQPVRLTKEPDGTDGDPVWSPDGSQIAFTRRDPNGAADSNGDVYVMSFDGSDPQPVAETPAADIKPSWSPDGKQLLVISNRTSAVGGPGKTWDMWLTRIKDGRVLRSMGLDADQVTTPFWNNR